MISGEQDPVSSVVLSDWVRDVNRSLLRKLEEDLRDASTEDPKNGLLIRCMKEIAILKNEISWLESELRECSQHLDDCVERLELTKKKKQNSSRRSKKDE